MMMEEIKADFYPDYLNKTFLVTRETPGLLFWVKIIVKSWELKNELIVFF